ncbi:hypothetical protein K469DRAFT_630618 [Zopfia rhizophila CBS 207.26]|uniref:Uncharacterized protein n=1 Tax=Zopfia rhizophila CBS 207.26 TaxID=1314779 RepID=A0A6A6E7Z2_9PEZI|nr:hypothetical protein K469DRAFT_630618 [Zopfia rhizophila CBS 207.26]
MSKAFPFLRLPLELREAIYSLYFNPASLVQRRKDGAVEYKFDLRLYRVNKQIYSEAQTVFRRENVFIRIETPWLETVSHIARDGSVPIVAAEGRADEFRRYHSLVEVTGPLLDFGTSRHSMIILLDDLYEFCKIWFYSALNYPNLNPHLRITFVLQDPYYPADPKPIPLSLQKRLLLPFENVKGLRDWEAQGYDDSVKEELAKRMAVPYQSVGKCCEDSTAFMEAGDRAIAEGLPDTALELYQKAFHAIHILIMGRNRNVLADTFFHAPIESGRYNGQEATTVRIILRVKLVSRTINAYLKLRQFEEAAFWGMRSIKIMREAIDSDYEDFLTEFTGLADVGFIYLRTAIAFEKMEENKSEELKVYDEDDFASSWRLFPLAIRYLGGRSQKVVQEELKAHNAEWDGLDIFKVGRQTESSDVDSLAPMNQALDADVEVDD